MALTQTQREEVENLIGKLPCVEHGVDLVKAINALEEAKSEMVGYRESLQAFSKMAERLSIVVVGDEELNIPGLGKRIESEERSRQALAREVRERWQREDKREQNSRVNHAKLAGFIIGVVLVLNILLRVAVHFLPAIGINP